MAEEDVRNLSVSRGKPLPVGGYTSCHSSTSRDLQCIVGYLGDAQMYTPGTGDLHKLLEQAILSGSVTVHHCATVGVVMPSAHNQKGFVSHEDPS